MSHVITLSPSGNRFSCTRGQTILVAGLAEGVGLPFSCRSGLCRSCRGKVLQGQVDPGEVHPAYLNERDRALGYVHLCQAHALSDCIIEVEEWDTSAACPIMRAPARIVSMQRAAPDVMILWLSLPPNESLRFQAGQYLDITDKNKVKRSYSIANAPAAEGARQVELHVRHMPGGLFTDALFSQVKLKDLVQLEGPLGQCVLKQEEAPLVLVASGTGFAPIKAMVEEELSRGSRRPIHLYWGGRTRADLYLTELAQAWSGQHAHIQYTPVLSEPTQDCQWSGRTGFVHRVVMQDHPDLSGCLVYACGAPVMVESARNDFTRHCGLPEHAFHADAFISQADQAAARPEYL